MPEIWPGEKGFTLLTADEELCPVGVVTRCWYHFKPGAVRYVDKRDMPKLSKVRLSRASFDAAGAGAQDAPKLDGDSEGSGKGD